MNGFLTNPDTPGTEKLVVCSVDDRWLTSKKLNLSCESVTGTDDFLPPQNVFLVKGFHRATCALLVMMATYELPPLMEAGYIDMFK